MFNEAINLRDRLAVITGGNSGLGKETAIKLASLGAETIILCRNPEKADAAVAEIKARSGNDKIKAMSLDLSSLKSIKQCAEDLKGVTNKIDILVNNAGVMALPNKELTEDGFERQMGINHLGHFSLTSQIFQLLQNAPSARIVNVASSAHLFNKIDKEDFMLLRDGAYQSWIAYGNSKLSNILFTKELSKKLAQVENNKIAVVCCHPGVCRTELGRYMFEPNSLPIPVSPGVLSAINLLGSPLFTLATKSSIQGAQTSIHLAASRTISTSDSGKYFDNSKVSKTGPAAIDEALAKFVWEESEKLTGLTFAL
jgi:NAD(P)-dependent dehydrogenase (short-subunit alcohol dehydrogenase family)